MVGKIPTKQLPCKECWSYELKWFIIKLDGICRECNNLWHSSDTRIPTVEKVALKNSDTMTLSHTDAKKGSDILSDTSDTDTINESRDTIMAQHKISKRTFYRWLSDGKVELLDGGIYKVV